MKNFTQIFKQPTILIILLVITGFCKNASAANRYAVADGNWNSTSTWASVPGGTAGASVPGSSDDVYIITDTTGRFVTIPDGYTANCDKLYIGDAADLTANGLTLLGDKSKLNANEIIINRSLGSYSNTFNIGGGTVNVSGKIEFRGNTAATDKINTILINAGTLTVKNIEVAGGSAVNNIIEMADAGFLNNSDHFPTLQECKFIFTKGTVTFNKGGAQNIPAIDYYNLTLGGSGDKTIAAGNITVKGNLLINSGVTYKGSTNNPAINIQGNFTNNGTFTQGTGQLTLNGAVQQTISGSTAPTFTNLIINNSYGTAPQVDISKNLTVQGAFELQSGVMNINKVTITCANLTIGSVTSSNFAGVTFTDNSSRLVANNITINRPLNAGSNTLNVGDGTVTVSGSLTMAGSSTASGEINKIQINKGSLTVSGDIVISEGSSANNRIEMTDAGFLYIGNNFSSPICTITSTQGTVVYNKAGAQTIAALDYYNLTMAGSGIKTIASGTLNIKGNLLINAGSTYQSSTNNSTVNIYGNFTNNGTFTQGSEILTFKGAVKQTISGTTAPGFTNINIENTYNTTPQVVLATNITASNLKINQGTLDIPANYTATCGNLTIGSVTGSTQGGLILSGSTSKLNATNITINRPTGAYSNILNADDGAITVSGSLTMAGSSTASNEINKIQINKGSVTVSGDIIISGGSSANNRIEMTDAGFLYIGNNFSTSICTITSTQGTVVYNKAGAQTIAALDYYNLTMAGSGIKTIASGTLNIKGNLLISAGSTYQSSTNNSTVNIYGNFTNNGTFTQGSEILTFKGGVKQTISGTTAPVFTNINIENTYNSVPQVVLATNITATNLKINSGTLDIPANYTANCGNLTIGSVTGSTKGGLILSGATSKLNATNITINRPVSANTNMLDAGDGTVTAVTINIEGASLLTSRIVKILINKGSLTSSGGFIVNGGSNVNNTIEMADDGFLYLPSGFSSSALNLITTKGTVVYNKNGDQNIEPVAYYNLTLAGSGLKTIPAGTFTVKRNLLINSGVSYDGATNNPALLVGGNFTNNGTFSQGTGSITLNGTVQQTVSSSTPLTLNNFKVKNTSGSDPQVVITANITVTGSFELISGTLDISSSTVSGTNLTIGNLTDATETGLSLSGSTSSLNVSNITINRPIGGYTNELDAGDGTLNVSGAIAISGTSTQSSRDVKIKVNKGTLIAPGGVNFAGGNKDNNSIVLNNDGILNLSGEFTSALCQLTADKGTVIYNKTGSQTIIATNYNNLILGGSGTKTMESGTIELQGNLIINSGVTYNGANNPVLIANANFTNNGTFNQGNGKLTFFGKNKQTITSAAGDFTDIKIENSYHAAPQVVIATDITVKKNLELKSGLVAVNDKNITIDSGATVTGGSKDAFIYTIGNTGVLKYKKCIANTTKFFPIGHTPSAVGYAPATITFNTGHTTDDYSINVDSVITVTGADTGTERTKRVVKATWHVSESSPGGSNLNFRFQWDEKRNGKGLSVTKLVQLLHYTNGKWEKPAGKISYITDLSGNTTIQKGPYMVNYYGYTGGFSPFGTEGDAEGTLPVTWLKVNGARHNNENIITWSTATEINNNFFKVESSVDGNFFKEIGHVQGAGNKATISNYSFIDRTSTNATMYYRIAQIDFDGTVSYSDVISINPGDILKNSLSVYPNPVDNIININVAATQRTTASVIITDITGLVIYTSHLDIQKGDNMIQLDLSGYTKGMYFIEITDNKGISQTKRIVKN